MYIYIEREREREHTPYCEGSLTQACAELGPTETIRPLSQESQLDNASPGLLQVAAYAREY